MLPRRYEALRAPTKRLIIATVPMEPPRTRTASEVIAGKEPRCFDARLVRDRTDALWGIDVGIPEDSTQLLVKAVVGAKARPPLRNGDRIVAIDGANCARRSNRGRSVRPRAEV